MSDQSKDFNIGQVVYVLSNKTQAIVPALIIEETTIKALSKKEVTWKVAIGPSGSKQKIIQASDLNGELFASLGAVEAYLQARLNGFIKKVVDDATKNENNWYRSMKPKVDPKTAVAPPPVPKEKTKLDPESILSEFDGSLAAEHPQVSESFQQNLESYTEEQRSETLRQKLRNSIAPSAEDLKGDVEMMPDGNTVHTIMAPDGARTPFDLKV